MKNEYQELVTTVSQQVAKAFLRNEDNLAARATLLDADISEITRQIGRETTKLVVEQVRDDLVKKTTRRIRHAKSSRHLVQYPFRTNRTHVAVFMEGIRGF